MIKRIKISAVSAALILLVGCLSAGADVPGLTSSELTAFSEYNRMEGLSSTGDTTEVSSISPEAASSITSSAIASSSWLTITSQPAVVSHSPISGSAVSSAILPSSAASSGGTVVSVPDVDVKSNIELTISQIKVGTGVTQVYYTLRYTDDGFFAPHTYVDFEKFIFSEDKGKVLYEGVGNNEFYNGPRCSNNTESPVNVVEGWLTMESAKLQNVQRLILSLKNMTIYSNEVKELSFNITDYLVLHPELKGQTVALKPEGTSNGMTYYQEPNLPKNNLNLRFDDASDFVISNLTVSDGFLFMRVDFDVNRYMTGVPQFTVTENGQSLRMALSGVSSYDGNYTLVYPLSQTQGSVLSIQSVCYRKTLQKAGQTWAVGKSVDQSRIVNALSVTKVVGGTVVGGKIGMFGTCGELVRINAAENEVSLEMKESGTYTASEEAVGGSCLFDKYGKRIYWKNMINLKGFMSSLFVLENFTPDQLGAVVVSKFYKDDSVDQYIFANFDYTAGTCNLYMIHDTSADASWDHVG